MGKDHQLQRPHSTATHRSPGARVPRGGLKSRSQPQSLPLRSLQGPGPTWKQAQSQAQWPPCNCIMSCNRRPLAARVYWAEGPPCCPPSPNRHSTPAVSSEVSGVCGTAVASAPCRAPVLRKQSRPCTVQGLTSPLIPMQCAQWHKTLNLHLRSVLPPRSEADGQVWARLRAHPS